jgi:DNA-binding LacI/PurR family transcriptional regulator
MSRRDGKGAKRESKVKKADGPVSLKRLAAHLGLSPTTLSLVLNDSPLASTIPQETKDRILVAAREFDYRPNFIARSLRSARTFTLGVLAPEISSGYASEVLGGDRRASPQGGILLLRRQPSSPPGVAKAVYTIIDGTLC